MKKTMIMSRKLKLVIVNEDRDSRNNQYQFIHDSQYAQYRALNIAYGYLLSGFQSGNLNLKSEEYRRSYNKMMAIRERTFNDLNIIFGRGIGTSALIKQKIKLDFINDVKNGLANGDRSGRNYKRTFPLMINGNSDKIYDENKRPVIKFYYVGKDIHIRWVNGIVFKVVIGREDKDYQEITHFLDCVISGQYRVSQSSLYFNKNNKLILNLSIRFEIDTNKMVEKDRSLGVDLGIAIPAYCTVSDQIYIHKGFGSANDFTRIRTQMIHRKTQLQKDLVNTRGGRGRKHKLKPLERLKTKEANWCKTYNHVLSKNIVKYALDNQCEFINFEKLTKNGFDNCILRRWSYYQLQQMIEYKAQINGIKVRFINPAYTSQKCSKCGHTHTDNRKTQDKFECMECGCKLNADYNASINIARSTEFIK